MAFKFPYGISDFAQVINEGYFYIDRTDRIPQLEAAGQQLIFLRPRRFGKSLLLSMLANYYDIAQADQFDHLFGHLAIGRAPTPRHNRYFVMRWDFSAIESAGNVETIRQALHDYLNDRIARFAASYTPYLPLEIKVAPDNALSSFQSLLTAISLTPYRLYLLIDEYDNFANEIVMGREGQDQARYEALLHGEGVVKSIFKAIKAASSGDGLERVFITGVSPMVLSDMSSGYNVARDIFLNHQFNDLCGFRDEEVSELLQQLIADHGLPPNQATDMCETLRVFYNGYRFHPDSETRVYNPTMVLYFCQHLQENGAPPDEMLDSNLAMDQNKLQAIAQMPNGGALVMRALNPTEPLETQQLSKRYNYRDLMVPAYGEQVASSLLYYLGVLTLNGYTPLRWLRLMVPNLVIRRLYVEAIRERWLPGMEERSTATQAALTLYRTGDMAPLCDVLVQQLFPRLDNRDYRWANELTIKIAFLTLLFNDFLYLIDSEQPLDRGYADLVLIRRPTMRQAPIYDLLLEFKYLSLADIKLSGQELRALPAEALHAIPAVAAALDDATHQALRYQQELHRRHAPHLTLRTFAVLALGFDRILWRPLSLPALS